MAFGFPYCRCMHESVRSLHSRPARWRTLVPLTLPIALAHLALAAATLSHAETVPNRAALTAPAPTPMAVRVVEAPGGTPVPAPRPAPALPAEPSAAPSAAPAPPPAPRSTARQPIAQARAVPASATVAGPVAASLPAAESPVYPTRIPPPTTLRYVISRGPWSGHGELVWEHQGERYHARLEGRVAGFKVITWDSSGLFDTAGLAPVRFTDERRGRAVKAANFQRTVGKITYSGPPDEYPLLPGSQDRLSWMVQIAAIASADPKRVATGGRVSMFVSGARGDADVWTFQALGTERVPVGGASVQAIKLLREPRKPNDTRVEVWLDPALHHLPVRARLTSSPENETLELVRRVQDPS